MPKFFIALLPALLSLLLFVRCKKSDQPVQQTVGQQPALLKITLSFDSSSYNRQEQFSYDAQGNMTKILDEEWDDATPESKHLVNAVDLEVQPDGLPYTSHYTSRDQGAYLTIQYLRLPGHDVVQKRIYGPGSTLLFQTWLGLDAKGRIIADTTFEFFKNRVKSYSHFTYDENDNVVRIEYYSADSSGSFFHATTNLYTYDQQVNPFYSYKYVFEETSMVTPYFTYFGKNNMLTHTQSTTLPAERVRCAATVMNTTALACL